MNNLPEEDYKEALRSIANIVPKGSIIHTIIKDVLDAWESEKTSRDIIEGLEKELNPIIEGKADQQIQSRFIKVMKVWEDEILCPVCTEFYIKPDEEMCQDCAEPK